MKFKVGDRVRIKDCGALREWSRWKEVVGKVGVIDGKTVSVCLIDNNKYDINFTDEMLELADKKDSHKFKVGDRVKHKDYGVGIVKRYIGNYCGVEFSDWYYDWYEGHYLGSDSAARARGVKKHSSWWCLEKHLTLASVSKDSHKFKVGDKVRMINPDPTHGFGNVRVGDQGIIIGPVTDYYIVDFPKQSYWSAEEKDIEFLGENKKEKTYVVGCEPYWTQYLLAEPITNFPKREKGLLMTGLKKVTNLIEGLKQPRQDYVRLDWVEIEDDEYVVTELGEEAQSDVAFGLVKHPTLAEYAKSEVARLVKEEKSSK